MTQLQHIDNEQLVAPAQSSGRAWSDALDEHVLVVILGQLQAEHVPATLD